MRDSETRKRHFRGAHRIRSPEATWDRIAGLRARVGVTRVADVTGLDTLGIPVYQAVRPEGRALSVSQGKGPTPASARVGALMESLEVWHAERLEDYPSVVMTLLEMELSNAIDVARLPRNPWSPAVTSHPLHWHRAHPVGDGRRGWLPRQMLSLDFRVPEGFSPKIFRASSTGVASGNCREEAVLHGLCEAVERHAMALVASGAHAVTPLDTAGAAPYVQDLIARIGDRGLRFALYDATWDVGIPVMAADIVGADLPIRFRGWGCHPSPDVAASRAITEAAQSRLTYISGARDDVVTYDPRRPFEVHDTFVTPEPSRRFEEIRDVASMDVRADLDEVATRLRVHGHSAWYVDLTRDEIGLPVVICHVQGLRDADHA